MNENDKWSMSYSTSWTQPYSNWSHPISSVEKEMAVIEAIDNIVSSMTAYLDAERLLSSIMTQK